MIFLHLYRGESEAQKGSETWVRPAHGYLVADHRSDCSLFLLNHKGLRKNKEVRGGHDGARAGDRRKEKVQPRYLILREQGQNSGQSPGSQASLWSQP